MSLKIYNTMTRSNEELIPIESGKIRLYTCGHTVYSEPHIGNWATYIYWDVLVRNLRANGFEVEHVQNITDVGHLTDDEDQGEDKLQKAAEKERKTAWEIAEFYIDRTDYGAQILELEKPTHSPRATEYMDQQISLVKQLEDKGYTYTIEGDGVYFDTSKLDDYGKLARLDIEGLRDGARVRNDDKKNVTDFALWKFSPKGAKRDMEWESPWGVGFPGWHVECSVMAQDILGETIDVHTGGIDHISVHHTNEIAQSESVTGKEFSKLWVHANHIKVNGTKMSKSLGNVYTLLDLEKSNYDMRAFRLLVLSSHYRTESNFTWKLMDAAQSRLRRWQSVADLRWQAVDTNNNFEEIAELALTNAAEALDKDLDTPIAISQLESVFNFLENNPLPKTSIKEMNKFLEFINERLGINLLLQDIPASSKQLIKQRQQARDDKDFGKSDKLREQLNEIGLLINDTATGQIWSRK